MVTRCNLKDHPGTINHRDGWRGRERERESEGERERERERESIESVPSAQVYDDEYDNDDVEIKQGLATWFTLRGSDLKSGSLNTLTVSTFRWVRIPLPTKINRKIWGLWSNPLLLLLPGLHWHEVEVPVRIISLR